MTLSQEEKNRRQLLKLSKRKAKLVAKLEKENRKKKKRKEKKRKKAAKDLIKKKKEIKRMGEEIIKRSALPKIDKPPVNPLKSRQVLSVNADLVRLQQIKSELKTLRAQRRVLRIKIINTDTNNSLVIDNQNARLRVFTNKIKSLVDERREIKSDSGLLDLPPIKRQ